MPKSYNMDTHQDEVVEKTCKDFKCYMGGYCPRFNMSMSPTYHCDSPKES